MNRAIYYSLATLALLGVGAEYGQSRGYFPLPSPLVLWPRPAGPEIHYAPAEDLEAIDVETIGQASERLDVAAYVLTDAAVIEALADAAERGVAVRIARWPDSYEINGLAREAMGRLKASPNVAIRFKRGGDLMHLKSYCADGVTLRAGAANFSRSGGTWQNNDLWILRGRGVCAPFLAAFEALWATATADAVP